MGNENTPKLWVLGTGTAKKVTRNWVNLYEYENVNTNFKPSANINGLKFNDINELL